MAIRLPFIRKPYLCGVQFAIHKYPIGTGLAPVRKKLHKNQINGQPQGLSLRIVCVFYVIVAKNYHISTAIQRQEQAPALHRWMLIPHSQTAEFSLFFCDIPHFIRCDIFAFAKVILRLRRSDILFASLTAARQYHSAESRISLRSNRTRR